MTGGAAHRLKSLRGWPRLAAAFAAGLAATAALPPLHAVPALWLAFPALLWLLDGCATWRAAAAVGWAFGFGHFLSGFYWIANAFYVDSDTFGLFAVPAVVALSAGFGFFTALPAAATHPFPPAHPDAMPDEHTHRAAVRALILASAWTGCEWLRSWVLTGFPWNMIATAWMETATPVGAAVAQSASAVGGYGLSLLTVAAAAMAAVLGHAPRLRAAWIAAGAPLALLAAVGTAGAVRMAAAEAAFVPGIKLRLVQPNIPQADKWRPGLREQHLEDHVRLSVEGRPADVTHVIWSEAAVAFFLDRDETHRRIAAQAAPPGGLLISGVPRAAPAESGARGYEAFNSLIAITAAGEVAAQYDKHHLVPFGEYVPLQGLIPFDMLTGGALDSGSGFSAGPGPVTLQADPLPPFSPLICYEIIFPAEITAADGPRPDWLLNVTNDSWFGDSAGPRQHFAQARLRAVEQGLPLVRAAGTGISAVVDAYGRVTAQLPLGARGVLDAPLPQRLPGSTPYAALGDWIPLGLAALTALAAVLAWRRLARPAP